MFEDNHTKSDLCCFILCAVSHRINLGINSDLDSSKENLTNNLFKIFKKISDTQNVGFTSQLVNGQDYNLSFFWKFQLNFEVKNTIYHQFRSSPGSSIIPLKMKRLISNTICSTWWQGVLLTVWAFRMTHLANWINFFYNCITVSSRAVYKMKKN